MKLGQCVDMRMLDRQAAYLTGAVWAADDGITAI